VEYPHEMYLDDESDHRVILSGLARECPSCKVIDHYDVKGRRPVEVVCKCGHRFTVQKFKRGERPGRKG
jgi:hypothetical protein